MGNHCTIMFYHIIVRLILNIFLKNCMYYKKDPKFGRQNFGYLIWFVPDWSTGIKNYYMYSLLADYFLIEQCLDKIFAVLKIKTTVLFMTIISRYLYWNVILMLILCGVAWNIVQYIPRNMHTVFALLCFVVVIQWLIFPYPAGLLHWHCGNLTIAPVPAKQPWWIWINTSCEFIMNDCITTTKQSTTKPCACFLGYTVLLPITNDWWWFTMFQATPHANAFTNTLKLKQNWWHFASNICKRIFLNENCCSLIRISLKFVPKGPIDNLPALVQMGQVTKLRLSCYLVLLSVDSKTR